MHGEPMGAVGRGAGGEDIFFLFFLFFFCNLLQLFAIKIIKSKMSHADETGTAPTAAASAVSALPAPVSIEVSFPDVVRLLLQFLRESGLSRSAAALQEEGDLLARRQPRAAGAGAGAGADADADAGAAGPACLDIDEYAARLEAILAARVHTANALLRRLARFRAAAAASPAP